MMNVFLKKTEKYIFTAVLAGLLFLSACRPESEIETSEGVTEVTTEEESVAETPEVTMSEETETETLEVITSEETVTESTEDKTTEAQAELPEEKSFSMAECGPLTDGDRYLFNPTLVSQEFKEYYQEEGARFYRDFIQAYLNHETVCRCPSEDYALALYDMLEYECPFYTSTDVEYGWATDYDPEEGVIRWHYYVEKDVIDERYEAVKAAIQAFLDLVPVSENDEAVKVQTLYHAFCPLMTYDHEGNESRQGIDSCYVFTEHHGICVSFSYAFNFLLESMGMRTTLAHGITDGGEAHVWSNVTVNGAEYYFDTTFELNYLGGTAYVYYGMNEQDRAENGVQAENQNHGRYSYVEPHIAETHLNPR